MTKFDWMSTVDQADIVISHGIVVAYSEVSNSIFSREYTGYWLGGDLYARIDHDTNNSPKTSVYLCSRSVALNATQNFGLVEPDRLSRGVLINQNWIA